MTRLLTLVAALLLGALIAWSEERLPAPAPADAPPATFSAARAMTDVERLAAAPHPTGSPEHARVRDALISRMFALGLAPQVRRGVGVFEPRWARGRLSAAPVENIVGVLPGRDRTAPALLLMAHYDSVPGSPGAADDSMGVAAALETARALKARGAPARDVILLFTDGEEVGLLGANQFFRRDPLARRVGLVLNLEARGSSGRAQMFQTSPRNGGLVDLFQRTAHRPASSSLAVFLYEHMPNDTDLSEALLAGAPGMNYAILGGQFDYHSPTSTPANLDRGSLQHMGDQFLAAAGAAAVAAQLPQAAPSKAYNDLFGDIVIAYPTWVGWLILAAAGALLALSLRRARAAEPFPVSDIFRGMAGLLFAVLATAATLQLARKVTGAEFGFLEQRPLLAQAERWEWALMLAGVGALLAASAAASRGRPLAALPVLAAGLGCSAFGGFDVVGAVSGVAAAALALAAFERAPSRAGAWGGVLLLGLLATAAMQVFAPEAACMLAWPLLAAALVAAITQLGQRGGWAGVLLVGLVAAVTAGWLGGFAHSMFLGLDLAPLLAGPAFAAALVLWPLMHADDRGPVIALSLAVLAVALSLTLTIRTAAPWSARRPQVSEVSYLLDQDTGGAWRFSPPDERNDWVDKALTADGGAIARRTHWAWRRPMLAAPARPVAQPATNIALKRSADGDLQLTATPPPGTQALSLRIRADKPGRIVAVAGVRAQTPLPADQWVRLHWASAKPLVMDIRGAGTGRLDVRHIVMTARWPRAVAPLPPRPADLMAWDTSDSTFVAASRAFTW